MEQQIPMRETSRREMLRLSGMGALAGVAVGALGSGRAQAQEGPPAVSYASWIHGNGMQVEYPDRVVRLEHDGWGTVVEGKPGTANWFHFVIPTPVIVNDVRLRAHSILLSFSTGSADAFVRDVHVWDGSRRIAALDDVNLQPGEPSERLLIPDTPAMGFGLGISLGVGFGVEPMDHSITFYAAGCDFVAPAPAEPSPQ
jgi:hypothetical protein